MDNESKEMFQRLFEKLDNIEGRLDNLEKGQADIQRQLYRMDRKISDTYNLALDAWGQGVENRKWLESSSKIEA